MLKNPRLALKTLKILVIEQPHEDVRRLAREVAVEYGLADRTGESLYEALIKTDPT